MSLFASIRLIDASFLTGGSNSGEYNSTRNNELKVFRNENPPKLCMVCQFNLIYSMKDIRHITRHIMK